MKKLSILFLLLLCALCLVSAQAEIKAADLPEYLFSQEDYTLTFTRDSADTASNTAVTLAKTDYTVHFEEGELSGELTLTTPVVKKATVCTLTSGKTKLGSVTVLPRPHFTCTKGYVCNNSGTEVKMLFKIDKVSMLGSSKIWFELRDEDGNVWDSKMFHADGANRNFVFKIPEETDGQKVWKVAVFLGDEQLSDWTPVYSKQNVQVLRRIDTSDEKTIVVTVDCGAGGSNKTLQWLELLKKYDSRATFFVTGEWAKGHPDAVQAIYDAGFEIGSHSYSHPDFTTLDSLGKINKELDDGIEVIRSIVGDQYEPRLFRYPKGNWTYTTNTILRGRGLELVQWTNTGGDSDSNKEKISAIIKRYKSMTPESGSIILFHNGSVALDRYDEVFEYFISQGYKLVAVEDLLPEGPYTIDEEGVLRAIE